MPNELPFWKIHEPREAAEDFEVAYMLADSQCFEEAPKDTLICLNKLQGRSRLPNWWLGYIAYSGGFPSSQIGMVQILSSMHCAPGIWVASRVQRCALPGIKRQDSFPLFQPPTQMEHFLGISSSLQQKNVFGLSYRVLSRTYSKTQLHLWTAL